MFLYLLLTIFSLSFASCSALTTVLLPAKISTTNPVNLSCPSVNGSVEWEYINASYVKSILSFTKLHINLTSLNEVGEYICKQNGTMLVHFLVAYVAAPVFENARKSVTYIAGDNNKKVICNSPGSFPKVQFTWKRINDDLTVELPLDNFTNINVSYSKDSSTLHFTELTYDVQGTYECFVENEAANGTVEIQIRVKDRLAALWPFLGILCEVSLLITIIFVYEKKSKKASQVNSMIQDASDVGKPLNVDAENEGDSGKLRNRVSNNNHK